MTDLLEQASHYGDETSGAYDDLYDHNRNGFIGDADLQAVAAHLSQVCN